MSGKLNLSLVETPDSFLLFDVSRRTQLYWSIFELVFKARWGEKRRYSLSYGEYF